MQREWVSQVQVGDRGSGMAWMGEGRKAEGWALGSPGPTLGRSAEGKVRFEVWAVEEEMRGEVGG